MYSATEVTIFALTDRRSERLIPGLRGSPAVTMKRSEPQVSFGSLVPTMREPKPSTAADWFMSSAIPDARFLSAARWAQVAPTYPAPTTVILRGAIEGMGREGSVPPRAGKIG